MKYLHGLLIALIAIAHSTMVTIPVIDEKSREALLQKIDRAKNGPKGNVCKFYGSKSTVIQKLTQADVKQCRSILYVDHQRSPKLGNQLAEYKPNSGFAELSMGPAFEAFKATPSVDEWARLMNNADFQLSIAKTHGHDCVIINIDDEGTRTFPEDLYGTYELISPLYPEVSKIVFNAGQPTSSQFLSLLPIQNNRDCFQTQAEKKEEEAKAAIAATQKAANDIIDAQQTEVIKTLKEQLAQPNNNNEIALLQAAKDKQIRDLQQKVEDQKKECEIACLQQLIGLEEDIREREMRNRIWLENRKIFRKRHELKLQKLIREKFIRDTDPDIQKEIERLQNSISLLTLEPEKSKNVTASEDISQLFQI